ncbi:hypothetical protein MKX03_028041 [Papaver bracteatum]|nr:hypothetical protein MKX03_028041 [Papaver bracteatum]
MFTLRRASNHFRTRLHFGLRAVVGTAAPPRTYHTKSKSEISPIESNNLHQDPSNHRNLLKILGFIEQIKALENVEIREVLRKLSRRQMCQLTYQLSNWLKVKNLFTFKEEIYYVTRLDLIAKVIPETFKGERVYKTLLYNHIKAGNAKKAEQVFEKMTDFGFLVSGYACEQIIALYRKFDKNKIANVLLLIDENDVKPTRFTYQVLIDVKGKSNDIPGMEELVLAMKNDGFKLDDHIHSVLARHYIYAGFAMKAWEILKEMKTEDLEVKHGECKHLLPLYAALGKADQVERIRKLCESDGRVDDDVAGSKYLKKKVKSSSKGYIALVNVYVDHKLVAKCEDLVKRLTSASLPIDRTLCYSLVKFYVDAWEVEKADSVLQKASQQGDRRMKPSYKSFQLIMNQYLTRADIHNTEMTFHRLKQTGYASNIWDDQSLLQAYINSKVPAYGFRERIMADNLIPDKFFDVQLADVHPFKKTAMSSHLLHLENILR